MAGRMKSISDMVSNRNDLVCHSYLGGGSFGDTFKVSINDSAFNYFALKQVSIENYKMLYRYEERPLDKILREIEVLRKLKMNQNIVEYHTHWIEGPQAINLQELDKPLDLTTVSNVENDNWLFIQMAFCNSGDLLTWMRQRPTQSLRPPEIIRFFMEQILEGLSFIHNLKIVHRDLTPSNIFLHDGNIIKLGDFGLGKELRDGATHVTTLELGTHKYRSPEMLDGEGKYGEKTDVFSASLIFLELMLPQGSVEGLNNLRVEVLDILQNPTDGVNVFDRIFSKEWNTELHLARKMSLEEQAVRLSSTEALYRLQNQDKFLQELTEEAKVAKIRWIGVPPPTWSYFGRKKELQELERCFTNHETIVVEGRFLLGKTELVNHFVWSKRDKAHCLWLRCNDETGLLDQIPEFVKTKTVSRPEDNCYNLCEEILRILKLDDSIPLILVIDNATMKTIPEILSLEKSIPDGQNVTLIIIARMSEFREELEIELTYGVKSIVLFELEMDETLQMLRNRLPQHIPITFDQTSEDKIKEMGERLHNHPGFITSFVTLLKERQKGPDPFGLNSALLFLKETPQEILHYGVFDAWKKISKTINPAATQLLRLLTTCYVSDGKTGEQEMVHDCWILSDVGNNEFDVNGEFEPYRVKEAVRKLYDSHLITLSTDDRGAHSFDVITVPTLLRQLIQKELTENDGPGKEFINKIMSVRNHSNHPHVLYCIWEWAITCGKLEWTFEKAFRETSVTLVEKDEKVSLKEYFTEYNYPTLRKVGDIATKMGEKFGENDYVAHILKCHSVAIAMRMSVTMCQNDMNISTGTNAVKNIKELRSFQRENITKVNNRLGKLLLNELCPLASSWILRHPEATDLNLIKTWILEELKGPKISNGMEYVLIAFLSFVSPSTTPSLEMKDQLSEIGERLVENYLKVDTKERNIYLPSLMIFITQMDDVLKNVGYNEKYTTEKQSTSRFMKIVGKIERILKTNPVKNGVSLCNWIDSLVWNEGIYWWCNALLYCAVNSGVPFLCKVVHLLLKWNLRFCILFFPSFEHEIEHTDFEEKKKLRFQMVLETVRLSIAKIETSLNQNLCNVGISFCTENRELPSETQPIVLFLRLLYMSTMNFRQIDCALMREHEKMREIGDKNEIGIKNGQFYWISRSSIIPPHMEVWEMTQAVLSDLLSQELQRNETIEYHITWSLLLCHPSPVFESRRETFLSKFEDWVLTTDPLNLGSFVVQVCQFLDDRQRVEDIVVETCEFAVVLFVKRGISHETYVKPLISRVIRGVSDYMAERKEKLLSFGRRILSLKVCDINSAMMDICINVLQDDRSRTKLVPLTLLKEWLNTNTKVKFSSGSTHVSEDSYHEEGKKIIRAFETVGVGEIFSMEMGIVIFALTIKEIDFDNWKPVLKRIIESSQDNGTMGMGPITVFEEMQNWRLEGVPSLEEFSTIFSSVSKGKSFIEVHKKFVIDVLNEADIKVSIDSADDKDFFVI